MMMKKLSENDAAKLSVDDRREKPFHCPICGDTYEPCNRWYEGDSYDD